MSPIRVLPDSVINLISAGEVVERPASVVKELIENALDSGASKITVELQQGGRKSISVRDDGCGMNRHDLLLSIQRHATSKISSRKDLDSIETLGFRGEALPSIAAVTHLTVLTSDGGEGWKLRIDGGELRDVTAAARTRGTTVTASGLFFNQPARRRFLRQQGTELSWVERYITGCALSRGDVAFRLVHNNRELFSLAAGRSPADRLRERYNIPGGVRHIESSGNSGAYSAEILWFPDNRWNRKTHQFVLVNGRLVYAGLISGLLDTALAGPAGYPLLCCSLDIPGEEVDVNVHPAKREVRFRDPSSVRAVVESALDALLSTRREKTVLGEAGGAVGRTGWVADRSEYSPGLFNAAMKIQQPSAVDFHRVSDEEFPIVQIGRAYLVTTTDSGIALIDQHAAHERVLYETVLNTIRKDSEGGGIQRLLLPENVKLDSEEFEDLSKYRQVLFGAGFEFHTESDTLILTGVPTGTFHGISALRKILGSLSDPQNEDLPVQERVAAAAACAGSVKFGDRLSPTETRHLVDQLFATSDPFHCPHGRPTLIEISYDELEEKFGR